MLAKHYANDVKTRANKDTTSKKERKKENTTRKKNHYGRRCTICNSNRPIFIFIGWETHNKVYP